ncbi:MAG: hypothetical protein LBC59_09455 [Chitinispirillales bacterium]|jgi:hypothetical protein|nr:hypothetical protein [Chitinispirillales bacterium]
MPDFNRITVITNSGLVYDLSPFGRAFSESSELLTREDRAASGKLRRDIIAEKMTFSLVYDNIDTIALEQFESIFSSHKDEVLTLEIVRRDSVGVDKVTRYSVLMRPFARKRGAKGLWQGVTVEFVEV